MWSRPGESPREFHMVRVTESIRSAFEKFDLDKDGMVSFAEFNRGMADVVDLSVPIKE